MSERSSKEKLNYKIVEEIRGCLDFTDILFRDVSELLQDTRSQLELDFMRDLVDFDKKLISYREKYKTRSDL